MRDKSVPALYDWSIRARVDALSGGVTLVSVPPLPLTNAPPGETPELPEAD